MIRWIVGFTLVVSATAIGAAEKPKANIDFSAKKVIVFKDGYCLFHKSGNGTSNKEGECFTDDVPDSAVLGSFWALPTEGRLVSMKAGWESVSTQVTKDVPASSLLEILLANQGKRAHIELSDKGMVQGSIVQVITQPTREGLTPALADVFGVPQERLPGTPAHALAMSLPNVHPRIRHVAEGTTTYSLAGTTGTHVILRTAEGDVLLNIGSIKTVMITEMNNTLRRTLTTNEKTKRLTFRFDQQEKARELNLFYFRPGIRWIPTYRLSLSEDPKQKVAGLALQAEILNEAESIDETPLDIVVGVPNFRFRELPSPFTLEQTLKNTLQAAAPHLMGNNTRNDFSNGTYSQRSGEFRRQAAQSNGVGESAEIELPNELKASGAQDLFVYSLPKMSVKSGERIAVNIFNSDKIPYKDIYTWELRVTREDNEVAPSGSAAKSPLKLSKNEVWHQVEITNTTQLPWTTGAVMLMQGQQPLSQELLTYTSPKDACRVPITVSVETRGSYEERETHRDLKSLSWEGVPYARIEKEGSVHLCNNKSVAIEVEISVRLAGKATSASHEGKIVLSPFDAQDWSNYRGSVAVNNSSAISWKVKLGPGETFEPKISYSYYTRLQ